MPSARNLTAVLGPTNTGKTHLAVERMLGHGRGMIGLPLRLLAREVYDRVRLRAGDAAVALVTGEEKIVPASPRYWVSTVEAMPDDVEVPFLAIDEVQICADLERGHIFTDRVLNRRGTEETMLLGASTMRPILERLLPGTSFVSRPRFSKLIYAGQKKITRLPGRTAIVAFSAETVYAVAELVRRQRGGAAVVLGALSPRTRNAQVALYQSGDVDYIVATDAIGMGLNMDVDHVALASRRKFDGFQFRELNPGELAQVAGRAGRYLNDGTFGVTGEADPFDPETVDRLENHHFDPVRVLQWRNRNLDFATLDRLRKSLSALPRSEGLTRAQPGPDILALEAMAQDEAVTRLATSPRSVERLWQVCQIPDYRNISSSEHAHLVGRIFTFLQTCDGFIDEDWFVRQLALCERSEGDLDTLSNRISHIRTWTFVANRPDWLKAPIYWQARAREIEDKISDALHERLSQRFIDRRTSVLMRRLAQKEELMSSVEEDGAIHVEGEYVGHIKGFHFIPDGAASTTGARTLQAAALQAVATEIAARAKAVAVSADPDLQLAPDGQIIWQHADVGRLEPGSSLLKPHATVIASDQLSASDREAVQERLQKFVDRHIAAALEPLVKLEESEGLEGLPKGIAFQLVEHLGVLPRELVAADVKALTQEDRAKLRTLGVRFGAFHIFVPLLLKPMATTLRLLLWGLQLQKAGKLEVGSLPQPPGQGLTSAVFDRSTPRGFYAVCGYRICSSRVVRIDMLERLADLIRDRVFWRPRFPEEPRPAGSVEGGGFAIVPDMMSLVGCSGEEFEGILRSLGFRMQKKRVTQAVSNNPPSEMAPGVSPETPEELANIELVPSPQFVAADDAQPETLAELQPVEGTAAVTEEQGIEVWWPKDTGPFRHRHEKPHRRPRHRKGPAEATSEAVPGQSAGEAQLDRQTRQPRKPFRKPKPESGKTPPREPRSRPEKPADPDSPFAVLMALKAKMAANKG